MKLHEFAAIAILLCLVGWVAITSLAPRPTYANANQQVVVSGAQYNANNYANPAATQAATAAGAAAPSSGSSALGGKGESVTIPISVKYGLYDPREIRVKEGTNVKLVLDKNTFTGCMTTFNIWGLDIKQYVPDNNVVEFTADKPGTYKTSCPMGMGDGKFIVEAADGSNSNTQTAAAQTGGNAADNSAKLAPSPSGCGSAGGSGCGCGCGGSK